MYGGTEGGRTSDKFRVSGVSGGVNVSVTGQKLFVQVANTAMKMNDAIAGNSTTEQNKFTTR